MRGLLGLLVPPALLAGRVLFDDSTDVVPFPDDLPRGRSAGADTMRVLIVGNEAAVGFGVRTNELAMPGALARCLAAKTRAGVQVDLIAEPGLMLRDVPRAVSDRTLAHYDCVVLVGFGEEALRWRSATRWAHALHDLLSYLRAGAGPAPTFVVTSVPTTYRSYLLPDALIQLVDERAREVDRVSRRVCAGMQGARFVSLPGTSVGRSRWRTVEQYAFWSELIAESIRDLADHLPVEERWELDEARRQSAVDRMALTAAAENSRLQKVVDTARMTYGAEMAILSVLDKDVQVNVARSGSDDDQFPRAYSFCQHAIEERSGLIVEDATRDDRFRENPFVTGKPYIRFYLGVPVESPDGERLGALCVLDSRPRSGEDVNSAPLWAMAHLAERELFHHAAASPGHLL